MIQNVRMKGPLASKLITFAFVGFIGFLADTAIFYTSGFVIGIPLPIARSLSFFCAATVTWFGNRTLTFGPQQSKGMPSQWGRSLCCALISFVPNFAVFQLILFWLGLQKSQAMIALVFGILAGMTSNYLLSDRWVFR